MPIGVDVFIWTVFWIVVSSVSFSHAQQPTRAPSLQAPVTAQRVENQLIMPGERICQLKLTGRLADIEAIEGKGERIGQGLWDGSVMYSRKTSGLRAVVAGTDGNVLWLAISAVASSPWSDAATVEGLKFGSTGEEVRAAMGAPTRTIGNTVKALDYRTQGIAFLIPAEEAQAEKVNEIYVYWKIRTPGEAFVVPVETF